MTVLFKILPEPVNQFVLPLRGVHARRDVATVINEDEQGALAVFLPAFLPLLGRVEGLAAAGSRQPFRKEEIEDHPGCFFSSGGKLWRDGKIAVHAKQPGGIEGTVEVLQAAAYFGIAIILVGGVIVGAMHYRLELFMFDIQAKKLGLV